MEDEEKIFVMTERRIVNIECAECGSFVMKAVIEDEDLPEIYCENCYRDLKNTVEEKEELIENIKELIEK